MKKNQVYCEKTHRVPRWLRSLWRSKTGLIGLLIVLTVTICAVFAPYIAPYSPSEMHPVDMLVPPFFLRGEAPGICLVPITSAMIFSAVLSTVREFLC